MITFSRRLATLDGVNQDRAAALPITGVKGSGLLVVADGVSGGYGGAAAAQATVDALTVAAQKLPTDSAALRAATLTGIETANRDVLSLGSGGGHDTRGGSNQQQHRTVFSRW